MLRIKIKYRKAADRLWWTVTCPHHGVVASDILTLDRAMWLARLHCTFMEPPTGKGTGDGAGDAPDEG